MMKQMKIYAIMLVALVAMDSCVVDNPIAPEPEAGDEAVKAKLFGTWYTEYDAMGTINAQTYKRVVEYYQFPEVLGELNMGQWNRYFFAEPGDEYPIDDLAGGSGYVGVFDYIANSDGTIRITFSNLEYAVYNLSYYEPTLRMLHYANGQLTAPGVGGGQVSFALAGDDIENALSDWHVYLHGGDGEGGGTYETGISGSDADEPSRARKH